MNKSVVAAITVAINAYMEQEAPARLALPKVAPHPEISSWRVFGRHEIIRGRSRWQARRLN